MGSNYPFVVATAFAAASLASVSNAGLVGTNSSLGFYSATTGETFQERSFVVSSLLPEFYYSYDFGASGFGAFLADVGASSLTISLDFFFGSGSSTLYFTDGTRIALTIPESMRFDSFSLGASNDITGLALGDVSGSGTRTLLLDSSLISATAPGASFTINFTTSAVPGPSALVILSACAAFTSRRRR